MRSSKKHGWLSAVLLSVCLGIWAPATADQPEAILIRKHATWKYFAQPDNPPADWNRRRFDDSAWKSGATGIGYGDADDRTVLSDMQGRYRSVYIRHAFDWDEHNDSQALYLYLRFDDGFAAYLNGKQVASKSLVRTDRSVRVDHHEANAYEEFVIADAARLLRPGENLIAIEGHNVALDSSDFSLDPVLSTRRLEQVDSRFRVEEYLHDLDELERRLRDQSSYLTLHRFDWETALNEIRSSIDVETQMSEFVSALQKLLAQIGDCHANVSAAGWPGSTLSLPLRPADTADGLAALGINRDDPLDAQCPYLESIDGVPLEDWMAAASKFVARGSPQLVRRRSLEWLGQVGMLRGELGMSTKDIVTIGLRSADRTARSQKRLRLTGQRYAVAKVKLQGTRRMNGNTGYLRIATMDARLVDSIVDDMKGFRDTDGLIIDVRDNSGGTYAVLRAVYGFFTPAEAEPYVTNIAAYRLSHRFSDDHIAYRPTFRAGWGGWSETEGAVIGHAAKAFEPQWRPPAEKFSDWHYMVLSRARSGRATDDYFFYQNPVVVLCNAESFSATDGFLSAFADLPQVTILGEPSGGGSGATRRFRLPNTQVTIALSSMASFRPNGKLFDGNGVEVDVNAKPVLEDYTTGPSKALQQGSSWTDSVLKRAVDLIEEMER